MFVFSLVSLESDISVWTEYSVGKSLIEREGEDT